MKMFQIYGEGNQKDENVPMFFWGTHKDENVPNGWKYYDKNI